MKLTKDESELKTFFSIWEKNQFDLQKAWKFPLNKEYHMFWTVPQCSCDKNINRSRYLKKLPFVDINCPVHK